MSKFRKQFRIVFYSHDTMGLGHIRRNLLMAQSLAASRLDPDILMISGTKDAGRFSFLPNIDCLILPSLYKESLGRYRARNLRLSLREIVNLRKNAILHAITTFDPDVFIVDNVPRGACFELDQTLQHLRQNHKTKCVLGMRDIRDDAQEVKREWRLRRIDQTIRSYYDAVWVYGDPCVYDAIAEYGFSSEVAEKISYTGYFDQMTRLGFPDSGGTEIVFHKLGLAGRPFVLCLIGGGQDGADIAEAFVRTVFPEHVTGVLLTGPHMDRDKFQELAGFSLRNNQLRVVDFIPEPARLIDQAACVISMGGYNSVSEILSFEKRALIIPRVRPRREQLIRAQHLSRLGVIDMTRPEKVTPQTIGRWVAENIGKPAPRVREKINMNGLVNLPGLIGDLCHPCEAKPVFSASGEFYG